MKLPKKKNESKSSDGLVDYEQGWNSIIEEVEYLSNKYGDKNIMGSLSKTKMYYKGKYDCVVELEKLNKITKGIQND